MTAEARCFLALRRHIQVVAHPTDLRSDIVAPRTGGNRIQRGGRSLGRVLDLRRRGLAGKSMFTVSSWRRS
jgi:hypothetical protein